MSGISVKTSMGVCPSHFVTFPTFNTLKAQFNPICHLLALLEAHHILHVSRIRVNEPQSTAMVTLCTWKSIPFTDLTSKVLTLHLKANMEQNCKTIPGYAHL